MKIICSLLFAVMFLSTSNGQTKTSERLTWKGVTIDVSSPEDVISKFGSPEKEQQDRLDILNTKGKVFTQTSNNKEWKVLKYKEIEQATNVRFGFNKDNKLVFIKFNTPIKDKKKLVDVQAFLKSFENVDFKPQKGSYVYLLFGKHKSGYILAEINRGAFAVIVERQTKSVFDTKTIEDVPNEKLDGIVTEVQFISKSLENTDNADILK